MTIEEIMESMTLPIIAYDTGGDVYYINTVFETVFGWSLSEIKGVMMPYVPKGEQLKTTSSIEAAMLGNTKPLRTKRITKSGEVKQVIVNGSTVIDTYNGNTLLCVVIMEYTLDTEDQCIDACIKALSRVKKLIGEQQ
jgi:PAS domain S-box-containing protein